MKLINEAIHAALIFVPLHEIPTAIEAFLEHLGRSNEKGRPKQIELFQQQLRPASGATGTPSTEPPPATTSALSTASQRPAPGRPLTQRVACEAWRVMTLINAAIRAAQILIPLHKIPTDLGAFLEHLGRSNEMTRPKQIDLFLRDLRPVPG